MKKVYMSILISALMATFSFAASQPTTYSTSRGSGTIMLSGSGTYQTDLNQDLKNSSWNLSVDGALFLFPQLAAGVEFGYSKLYQQEVRETGSDPVDIESIGMLVGPRVYFFLGGKHSELTPFVKGGANYLLRKRLVDEEEVWSNKRELGLTASGGILLNLAKNVGLSVEAEYSFEKGTAVEDIDTKQMLIKFGIRSFLGE